MHFLFGIALAGFASNATSADGAKGATGADGANDDMFTDDATGPSGPVYGKCAGTASPLCQGPLPADCTGSSQLSTAVCHAWQDLRQATKSEKWKQCADKKYTLDPCACGSYYGQWGVNCASSKIDQL